VPPRRLAGTAFLVRFLLQRRDLVLESNLRIELLQGARILRLCSEDGMNRLTHRCMLSLIDAVEKLAGESLPLVITGNKRFFSAGADLAEISALDGPAAYEFSRMGQRLMAAVEYFPAPVVAAIEGYCMGGGLDLALACQRRIASPHAIFGHRGAALGLMTGWGGTQRLPRLVGKGRALAMFITAEKLHADRALSVGLIDSICADPLTEAVRRLR
jgi:enoyl-CoA hydratase